jgi:dephospho-CoA kinase
MQNVYMNTSSKLPIIGLSGNFASGKDTLAHYLVEHYHYIHVSTGDIIRQEAIKHYGSVERPVLHKAGEELRRKYGAGATALMALKLFDERLAAGRPYKGLVVSGLRSLGEAKAIKAAGGILMFTDAPVEIRYQRILNRQRDNETQLTLEEFKRQEETEFEPSGDDDVAFNVRGIRDMAAQEGHVLDNAGDKDEFIEQAKKLLGL